MGLNVPQIGVEASGGVHTAHWFNEAFAVKSFSNYVDFTDVGVMTKISGHPRTVRFLGVDLHDRGSSIQSSIVMELMSSDLYDSFLNNIILEQGKRRQSSSGDCSFLLHVALDIMLQVVDGVAGLHKLRLFHRDLKSNNILVQLVDEPALHKEGYVRVKLADFGLTQARSDNFLRSNIGTRMWIAPDEISRSSRRHVTPTSEEPLVCPAKGGIDSFAILCFEILTGKTPFLELQPTKHREHVQKGGRPELPANLPSRLASEVKIAETSKHEFDHHLQPFSKS